MDMLPFPGMPAAPERPPADNRTRDRARTARQRRDVAEGIHPLTGGRTFPDRGTCGTCVHRIRVTWHVKRYPKCDAAGTPTHGAATDVRAWWPACSQHEPRPTDPQETGPCPTPSRSTTAPAPSNSTRTTPAAPPRG